MTENNIHSGHRSRLRKKFIDSDNDSLEQHELLELLLFYTFRRANTNELAHALLQKFGSISGVLNASQQELSAVSGIGSGSADFIRLIGAICSAEYLPEYQNPVIAEEKFNAENYVRRCFENTAENSFLLMSIAPDGSLTDSAFLPEVPDSGGFSLRAAAETALKYNMQNIIIAHNVPEKSTAVPDNAEFDFLRHAAEIFSALGIHLKDYIICCCGRIFSVKSHGAFSFKSETDGETL